MLLLFSRLSLTCCELNAATMDFGLQVAAQAILAPCYLLTVQATHLLHYCDCLLRILDLIVIFAILHFTVSANGAP